ncbi:MAG: M24 family metallopeptidase, partial [Actinobacteria bacterium]|nr:M24 family metallopeptidase [Actinomycetota bacterium]
MPLQFAALEYSARAPALAAALTAAGLDTLLVTGRTNVRWLTGFAGSSGWVLAAADGLTLITDGRYGDQATEQLAVAGVDAAVVVGHTRAAQVGLLGQALGGRPLLGFEGAHISYDEHVSLSQSVDATWVQTSGMLERLRRTKDRGELERMSHAGAIADEALRHTLPLLLGEPTEIHLRDALDAEMRRLGAEAPSFDTIIAAGANATMPHHRPDHTRIVEGVTVVIDFGALFDGYHSDMTRTFV